MKLINIDNNLIQRRLDHQTQTVDAETGRLWEQNSGPDAETEGGKPKIVFFRFIEINCEPPETQFWFCSTLQTSSGWAQSRVRREGRHEAAEGGG